MNIDPADEALLARAAGWAGEESDPLVLARREGLEFATAWLYQRLVRTTANAAFWEQAQAAATQPAAALNADLVGVVPGAFHRDHRHTGADGERILRIARELGCAAEVIPLPSFGPMAGNAEILHRWLAKHRGRRIALLSLSKGSADVKQALRMPGAAAAFSDVAASVSLSGLVQGTPLVTWLRRRPLRWWAVCLILWWRGHSGLALKELAHGAGTPLAAWPQRSELPLHLQMVHVYGFPLEKHLAHPWAPRGYRRLRPLGPNDGGGILLGDLAALPGIVCPIWGADHYLDPAWDAQSLLRGIVSAALAPRQASPSAT